MLTAKQNANLLKAVELLHEADRLMQLGFGREEDDAEECYCIHSQIEDAADTILDYVQSNNPEVDAE